MNETMKKPRIANAMRGLRLSENRGPRSDFRAAGELEGMIPPAGEMSAKQTKGGRTKARLEYNHPPSGNT